jgi:hypothetical protein
MKRIGLGVALPLLGLTLLLAACLPKVAPPYAGGLATEPANLRPYKNEQTGVNMGLAPGWVEEPVAPGGDADLRAQFKKPGSSARMLVYCLGAFTPRAGIHLKVLQLTEAVSPSATRLWETQSLGGGNFDPEFSAWTGPVESDGKQVPMNFYIGGKLDNLGSHCKYAVWTIVGKGEASRIEGDFLAMMRSLK